VFKQRSFPAKRPIGQTGCLRQSVFNEPVRRLCPSIDEKVREEYKADENRTHGQQINRTNALSMTRDIPVGVFLKQQFGKAIKAFDDIVAKTREIIRPGRSVKRNKKTKQLYSMNYKRL
jgi:hypothetical protein